MGQKMHISLYSHYHPNLPEFGLLDIWEGLEFTEELGDEDPLGET